jgi:predicted RNase H-like HicB family nuclease
MSGGELGRYVLENTTNGKEVPWPNWSENGAAAYHCDVCFLEEDDGTFSALVMNLPGAGSCGATIKEAEENVKEAVRAVVESYNKSGDEIPWTNSISCEIPEGTVIRKWILVDA